MNSHYDPIREHLAELALDGVADEESGDVEAPTGHFYRVGRYVVVTDSRGFSELHDCGTAASAAAYFDGLELDYAMCSTTSDAEQAPRRLRRGASPVPQPSGGTDVPQDLGSSPQRAERAERLGRGEHPRRGRLHVGVLVSDYTFNQEILNALPPLAYGSHEEGDAAVCAMEALARACGLGTTDAPECASPVIGAFTRAFNDWLPSGADRDRLIRPLLPLMVGTADDGLDEKRAFMCADRAVRVFAPLALDVAGLADEAAELRSLPEIRDAESAARLAESAARSAAWSARLAAEAADLLRELCTIA